MNKRNFEMPVGFSVIESWAAHPEQVDDVARQCMIDYPAVAHVYKSFLNKKVETDLPEELDSLPPLKMLVLTSMSKDLPQNVRASATEMIFEYWNDGMPDEKNRANAVLRHLVLDQSLAPHTRNEILRQLGIPENSPLAVGPTISLKSIWQRIYALMAATPHAASTVSESNNSETVEKRYNVNDLVVTLASSAMDRSVVYLSVEGRLGHERKLQIFKGTEMLCSLDGNDESRLETSFTLDPKDSNDEVELQIVPNETFETFHEANQSDNDALIARLKENPEAESNALLDESREENS